MVWACSGQLQQGSYAYNSNKGKRERISRMMLMHANNREDIAVARTGDIVAVAGLKEVITGETLCDEKDPIILERMEVRCALLHGKAGTPAALARCCWQLYYALATSNGLQQCSMESSQQYKNAGASLVAMSK